MKENNKIMKNKILNYIVNNDLHSRFTISIIKKLATSGITKKDGSISFALCESYLEIVNGGYTDLIIDDLKQEVFIELMNLVNDDKVSLIDNELVFDDYIDKNGNIKSYYINLFHVVRNYMNNQKKHIDRSAIKIDMFIEDENIEVSVKNKNYRRYVALSDTEHDINNVVERNDIQLIFGYLYHKYPKHFTTMCKVFHLLYDGYTYDEIAKMLKITKDKVRYQIKLLRNVFEDTQITINYTHNNYTNIFSDTTRNTCTTTYINREIRKEVITTIRKESSSEKTAYKSIPLSCGILDTQTNEDISKYRKEYEENIKDTSMQYINVYNAKTQCIEVINEKGHTLYTFKVTSKPSKKWLKKYNIATL